MNEEILCEFLDLGYMLFQIFLVQVLLHDPLIGLHFLSFGIVCRNDVVKGQPDALVIVLDEAKDREGISSSRHLSQCCVDGSSSRITSSMLARWRWIIRLGSLSQDVVHLAVVGCMNMKVIGFFHMPFSACSGRIPLNPA